MSTYIFLLSLLLVSTQLCQVNPNQKQIILEEPQLLKTTTNGQKFIIGSLNDPEQNYIYVAKVKGTPFQMGKAFGELFQQQLKANIGTFYNYYLDQLTELLIKQHVPKFLAKSLTSGVRQLAYVLLDLNVMITKKYTHSRYLEQIRGIAVGGKVNKRDLQRINIVPEVIKAACTVAGVWGQASRNNETLHVRSLDWDANSPISKYPVITVYHPSTKGENMHANFAWVAFVGSLTGMSQYLSIGEKVWYPPKHAVKMTRYGNPWTYVLRDVLYDAHNISTALAVLTQAKRTCAIHLGLGSKQDHSFRMFEYAERILNNYNDQNYTHYNQSYHPKRAGLAFFDKGVQPNTNPCVGSLLASKQMYGKWELESLWRIIGHSHQTGDTQHVVFNLEKQEVLISYSRLYKEGNTTKTQVAYNRSPIYVNMNPLWAPF